MDAETLGAISLGPRPVVAGRRKRKAYGPASQVEHIQLPFIRWDGEIGPWREHFGKGRGQVHSLDGGEPERSCPEVEVAKRLRWVRDQAYWFSGYNVGLVPEIWQPWVASLGDERTPDWLATLDAHIRSLIGSPKGGMPDVVAWTPAGALASALFVECKGPGEAFGEAQEDWVWAAQRFGVDLSQIAICVRPF